MRITGWKLFIVSSFCLRASIDCVKLINEEHFVSGSQDGYVALLSVLPSNKQFGYIITAGIL